MFRFVYIFLFISFFTFKSSQAQDLKYHEQLTHFRKQYKEDFIKDAYSPLSANDTGNLRFYPISKYYCVVAQVTLYKNETPFELQTHNGKKKYYIKYAVATFSLSKKIYHLNIYQSVSTATTIGNDYLFLPFNDLTNYKTTYAGGRYIDLSIYDIKDNKIIIDFNKSYNPYCAYKEGYSCPIPPSENRLKVKIRAGEKLFNNR